MCILMDALFYCRSCPGGSEEGFFELFPGVRGHKETTRQAGRPEEQEQKARARGAWAD